MGREKEKRKFVSKLPSTNVEALKSLVQQKLELGEDEEALKILKRLVSAQPEVTDWKFLTARLLMDRCGEGEAVIKRLEEALRVAEEDKKEKEARDVRLIMAQIQFLQKNGDEALGIYQQLSFRIF